MSPTLLVLAAIALAAQEAPVSPPPAPAVGSSVDTSTGISSDTDAPNIEDIAAAAANPDTAPVITVMMSDRGSGVGEAFVIFRPRGVTEWARAALVGGGSGESSLFIARLPDGLQRSGFEYYVEATDKAGNGPARIGSASEPIAVDKAQESTRARVEREAVAQTAVEPTGIHPGFIMLSYGVGILAGAGAGAYLVDLNISTRRLAEVDDELTAGGASDERRAALGQARIGYADAIVYDIAIASVLGVVAVAGLATGTALLIASNLE